MSIKELITKRAAIKSNLTRFKTFFNNLDPVDPNLVQLEVRLNKLESNWDLFFEVQTAIESLDEKNIQDHHQEREMFENDYFEYIENAKRLVNSHRIQNNCNEPRTDTSFHSSHCGRAQIGQINLPIVNLPEFDGAYSEWLYFKDNFKSVIHENTELSDIQKFHYLRLSLKGEAADVIRSLEIAAKNYNAAWQRLVDHYEDKVLLVTNHVKALFGLPSVGKESYIALKELLNGFTKHLLALELLEEPVQHWDTLLVFLISNKFDPYTRREWERTVNKRTLPTTHQLTEFLKDKCAYLQKLTPLDSQNKFKSKSFLVNADNDTDPCVLCKRNHSLIKCPSFLKSNAHKRYNVIKSHNLCTNCLKADHKTSDCQGLSCKKCYKRHHTLLHFNSVQGEHNLRSDKVETRNNDNTTPVTTQQDHENVRENHSVVGHSSSIYNNVLLSTALIKVQDNQGNYHNCRALLDSGSQSNFITSELVRRLQISTTKLKVSVSGLNQQLNSINNSVEININSYTTSYKNTINCLVISKITDNLPAISFNYSPLNIPSNISLADPKFNETSKIDILLGAGIFWNLIGTGKINLGKNKPQLHESVLGWIISGQIPSTSCNYLNTNCYLISNTDLDNNLLRFWELEEYTGTTLTSPEHVAIEETFKSTTTRDNDGRFIVKLPFKFSTEKLGVSKNTAIKRLMSIESKLNRNPQLHQNYIDFMNEYTSLNHMGKVNNDIEGEGYYIPHHFVRKESSITTKLRVVFDASCKTNKGFSLNDILLVGPTIQQDLISIILRYRTHKYVLVGDITKMYRQVLVNPEDRKFQKIVWRSNTNEPIETFKLNTLTYGTASAPFLAVRCLHELAYQHMDSYPAASQTIIDDFYVDDLITGANNITHLESLYRDITLILNSGCFELNKWVSNSNVLLEKIYKSNPNVIFNLGKSDETHTLGLLWHSLSDTLNYEIRDIETNKSINKRVILSVISTIYDPLGLLGPVLVVGKILMQNLWQLKISWDEPLPPEALNDWRNFSSQLHKLKEITIPRLTLCDNPIIIEIHGFADASKSAYGACIYLRSIDHFHRCKVNLLCAKSRVAPLKHTTIPRLELCAALLLANLFQKVKQSLTILANRVYLWSDSTIALAWIKSAENCWKVFVANRVSEIQTLTNKHDWRYVNTQTNPADIISRGLSPQELINSKIWWNGPEWLQKSEAYWPVDISNSSDFTTMPPEYSAEVQPMRAVASIAKVNSLDLFSKYSKLTKLQRVVAYILRFKFNALSSREFRYFGPLTSIELNDALSCLIKIAQHESFSSELNDINKSNSVNSKSVLVRLSPFIDNHGILRVGGRLSKSQFDYTKQHPAILSNKHLLSHLVINYEHVRLLHAGAQQVLFSLRERIWIICARNLVRKLIHTCVTCFRVKPRDEHYIMADLPSERVTPSRPFLKCGVDFCGPFYLKDRKTKKYNVTKAYVCLFVCLSTKAIHLELTTELTTESFMAALHRFVARRGKCSHIFSDNGTNFVGANLELKSFLKTTQGELLTKMGEQGIIWQFIPPKSPHFGGIWEAGVKSTKFHIKRVVGESRLTFEEFNTILSQIEACLNSRPLYPLSSDPNDVTPLTPAHFLIGDTLTAIPSPNVTTIKETALSRYKRCQRIMQNFWARWSREYISELQIRRKWSQNSQQFLKEGTLVIIKDDHLPPLKWNLGRILALHPGSDGIVRVISVKTANGVYKRPVRSVCVLPSDNDPE